MRHFNLLLAVLSICGPWSPSFANSTGGGYRIKHFLSSGDDAKIVSVDVGYESGVKSGELFRAVRPSRGGVGFPVETGLLKVLSVHEHEAIAEVIREGSSQSSAVYGEFSGVMAGDLATTQKLVIARAKVLAPEISVKYSALFDDPKASPYTYELTPGGKRELRKVAEQLASFRAGMLLVEGHTDQRGSSDQNQIESYQRALTVRQILIDEHGFDEHRVTALGLGENEPISNVILPGNADRSRRIVLKVVPMPHAN